MASEFTADDVRDLYLSEQNGVRFSNLTPTRATTTAQLEADVDLDDDPLGSKVRIRVSLRDSDVDEDTEENLYEGTATLYVRRKKGAAEPLGPQLAEIVWPYLRMAVIEQAQRMGVQELRLPPFLNSSELQRGDAQT